MHPTRGDIGLWKLQLFPEDAHYVAKQHTITFPTPLLGSMCHLWLTDWLTDWLIDWLIDWWRTGMIFERVQTSHRSKRKAVNRNLATLRASVNLSGIFQIALVGVKTLWRNSSHWKCASECTSESAHVTRAECALGFLPTYLLFSPNLAFWTSRWNYLLTQFTFRDIAHLSDFKVQTSRLFRASCGDELEVLQLCGADVPTHVVTFIQGIKLIKFAFCVLNKKHSLCLRSSL